MNENQIIEAPVFYSFKPELISRGAYHEHLLRMQLMKSDLRRLDFDILQRETEIDQQKLKPDFIDKARDLSIFLDLSYDGCWKCVGDNLGVLVTDSRC